MPPRWGCLPFPSAAPARASAEARRGQRSSNRLNWLGPLLNSRIRADPPPPLTRRSESAALALTPKSTAGTPPATGKDAAAQETFLREVDDALREDQLRNLIVKRGRPILALVAGGLVGLAGWLWYIDHKRSVSDTQGETFVTALDQLQANRNETAKQSMAPLAKDGNPGYRAAVQITQAGIAQQLGKEADAAKALLAQGADVITQHTDSPAPLQAAAGRGIKAFGQSTDMAKFASTTQLTASVDEWGPYYIKRIGDVLAGKWTSTDTWGGFDSGLLGMSPFTNMPADVAALAAATAADIKSGKNKVFVGPLFDNTGASKLAAGAVMDDGALSGMQWLLKGIEGKLG